MADQFSQILALLQQQNAKLEALGTCMTELERQAQAESLGGAEASVLAAGPVTMTGAAGTMVAMAPPPPRGLRPVELLQPPSMRCGQNAAGAVAAEHFDQRRLRRPDPTRRAGHQVRREKGL